MEVTKLISSLKKDLGYKTWVDQFSNYIATKDRMVTTQLKYYLVYDIEDRAYSIKSEYTTTHNMIVLKEAILPSKKEVKRQIEIRDYKYNP